MADHNDGLGRLLGYTSKGRPVREVRGGAEDDSTTTTTEAVTVTEDKPADLGDAGKKALTEERNARKAAEKERDAHAAKLKEFDDRDKTETQRLTEERDALKAERDLNRVEATRLRLGLRYKLAEDDLDFLGSGTDEDMESRAKRLSERVTTAAPRGAVDQGQRGAPAGDGKPDMNALIRAAARGGDPF